MKILVLNCGSSSAKYMVYDWDAKDIMCKGIEWAVKHTGYIAAPLYQAFAIGTIVYTD
jgi:acetate kinase